MEGNRVGQHGVNIVYSPVNVGGEPGNRCHPRRQGPSPAPVIRMGMLWEHFKMEATEGWIILWTKVPRDTNVDHKGGPETQLRTVKRFAISNSLNSVDSSANTVLEQCGVCCIRQKANPGSSSWMPSHPNQCQFPWRKILLSPQERVYLIPCELPKKPKG